jgi:hypothetical protein
VITIPEKKRQSESVVNRSFYDRRDLVENVIYAQEKQDSQLRTV